MKRVLMLLAVLTAAAELVRCASGPTAELTMLANSIALFQRTTNEWLRSNITNFF